MKSCKSHEKKWNKEHQILSFQFFINIFIILMLFVLFFHVVCKILNRNVWIAKLLAPASCTELTLYVLTLPSMIVGKRIDFWNLTFVISDFYSMNMWVAWIVGLTEAIRQNFTSTVPLSIFWNLGKWQVCSILNCS